MRDELVSLYEKQHGTEHPDTLAAMNLLAVSCDNAGYDQRALRLYQQTYDLRRKVLGPDNLDKSRESIPFDSKGRFSFPNLPVGQYRLVIDTKADTPVRPSPSHIEIACSGAGVNNLEIKFS